MFIFSYHKNIYLYYNNYYLINKDYSIDKVNFELDKNKKSKCKIPPSNIKAFTDILFYPLFCFGFTVINKKSEFKPETELGQRMWQIDRLATDLYNQIIYDHTNIRLRSEKTSQVRTV